MNDKTRIGSEVDFDAPGQTQGYLRVPYSTTDSAYGWIPIPIIVINNLSGPSVLLMAGNHGDEYEGQVLLMNFLRELSIDGVRGRIIIIPAVNAPAVNAGTRVSPIDGGNLNRLFPGDPDGTPTQMIAHYVDAVLLPKVRYCFDFHSGGYSLDYTPSAHLVLPQAAAQREEALSFLTQFGMPNSIVIQDLASDDQLLLGSCRKRGVGHMSTELGGAASFNIGAYKAARSGLKRLLAHIGALVKTTVADDPPPTKFFLRKPSEDLIYARETGVFEANVDVAYRVQAGDLAGRIHFPLIPWRVPEEIFFERDGTVLARRAPARTSIGDCLFALGRPIERI